MHIVARRPYVYSISNFFNKQLQIEAKLTTLCVNVLEFAI